MDRFPAERFQNPHRRSSQAHSGRVSVSESCSANRAADRAATADVAEDDATDASERLPAPELTGLVGKYAQLPYTLVLENTALVARDHMANERTFLAWIRTGFVILSMGVVFTQMHMIQLRATEAVVAGGHHSLSLRELRAFHVLGAPLTVLTGVLALGTMVFGFARYLTVQSGLQGNVFPATRVLVLLVLAAALVIVVLVAVADIRAQS